MKLDHCSYRIAAGSLDLIVALFTERLGFHVLRRAATAVWMRRDGAGVDIQFKESPAPPGGGDRHNSHIAFLSETPREDLEALAGWFRERGRTARIGAWSEREFYLDVSDVFVEFALEAMRPELADYAAEDGVRP